MRRRLLFCAVWYLAAGNGCPRCQPVVEYCDVNQERCSPCNRLCFPGQGTNHSCFQLCPEYAHKAARDSQLMLKPAPSSPSLQSGPTQSFQSQGKVVVGLLSFIAVAIMAALVVCSVHWLRKRRATPDQVANRSYRPCPEEASHAVNEANGRQAEGREGRDLLCPGGSDSSFRAVPTAWDSRTDAAVNIPEWEMPGSLLPPPSP